MSQHHFTLNFPLKGRADAAMLSTQLPAVMPALFRAQDRIGRVHYSRFVMLSQKTLLFLGDFDGDFGSLMAELARETGPVFDYILGHVIDPPSIPIEDDPNSFVEWCASHLLHPVNVYSAYPEVTAREIKSLASTAGVIGTGELNVFLVILPIKSRLAFIEVQLLLRARGRGTTKDLDSVGTPHFAQFVPLEDHQIGFFTVYDGDFDTYIADVTKHIGPVFDLIFRFTRNAPPSPCRMHLQEFIRFAARVSRPPIGFYAAYPWLSVHDIHALVADSQLQPVGHAS